ncbi:MFS transporter [Pseudogemmobacter faecipullorum]|uniref:MFS transporter n=1 Tax=Pseudogemmobacter faecipullorum TaxID=2755041 RepID=A0ABS8CRE5_9RHOB|nr:MFS transporter [Pseudogemmobacter faecipullorum]MCB5411948.1 MFS transporter [Pseudogemmobacter faecipullorum]
MTRDEARSARWANSALFLSGGIMIGAWAPQIPLLLPKHGIDKPTLGILIFGLGIGAMIAMLFVGKAIPRFGTLPLVRLAGLGIVPVLPMVAFAPSLFWLSLAMVMFGVLMGALDIMANANAVEVERRLGKAIMSSLHGFWSLGGFIAGSLGALVISRAGGEVQALLSSAVILAIVLCALPFLRGEPPLPPEPVASATRSSFLPRELSIWLLGLMAFLAFVPEGAVLDWGALFLAETFGADEFTAGLGFALFAATMALIRFAGDGLRNRFGSVPTFTFSALIAGLGLALAALAPGSYIAIFGFALSGFGCANLVPVIFSAAGNIPGQRPGAALSVVTMIGYAGVLMAPATIGWLAENFGHRVTFGGLAAMILALAFLSRWTVTADHRQEL